MLVVSCYIYELDSMHMKSFTNENDAKLWIIELLCEKQLIKHENKYYVVCNECQSEDVKIVEDVTYIKSRHTFTDIMYEIMDEIFPDLKNKSLDEFSKILYNKTEICKISYENIKKQFSLVYISKYRGEKLKFHKIGDFTDEKTACDKTIEWLVKDDMAEPFDVYNTNIFINDYYRGEQLKLGVKEKNIKEHKYLEDDEMIQYLSDKCETLDDLFKICRYFCDSYFEDSDEWWIKKV